MSGKLRVSSGPAAGTTIDLNGDFTFGRDYGDGGSLGGDPEISREHARVTRGSAGELLIQDLGSTNGTFVNGHRIVAPTPIRPGDIVELGGSKVELAGDDAGFVAAGGSADAAGQTTRAGAVVAPPPAAPPARPAAPTGPTGLPQAPSHPGVSEAAGKRGGSGARIGVLAAIVGVLVGGAIAAVIWGAGESSAASSNEFSLMAEGWSGETLDPGTRQREIVITMKTFESPHGITDLRVHKYLDETKPPPQRTYDAIYTFSAQNGDTLVFSAAGDVTEPEGPDRFFGQTFEDWRVVAGTGVFEDAKGEGTITTAVDVAGRGPAEAPTGSNVVKHIQGTLELKE